jgi:hypothetical protein
MINRFLLILISAAILSQTMSSVVIFAGYTLNKEFITKNYCINKDKPKLSCEGKCHLMKELKAHEQNESKPLSPLKEKMETIVYLSVANSTLIYDTNVVVHISIPYIEKLPAAYHNQPFQPPRA